MRAVCFEAPGRIRLTEVPEPTAAEGELLLEVDVVGLCGSDLSTYRGTSSMVKYPVVPGHEISARVVGRGAGVASSDHPDGSRVTVYPYFNCGTCAACRHGRTNACEHNHTLGVQRDGALTRLLAVPAGHVVDAEGLPDTSVALIEPLSVGFHLSTRSEVGPGDTVAVFGCGAVGLGAIAASAFRGARVVAVDLSASKIELARRLGAAEGINSHDTDAVAELRRLTSGDGPDVVLECAGSPVTFQQCLDAVRFTGRMGIVSYSTKKVTFNTKPIVSKELDIHGSRNALGEFSDVQAMIRSGRIPVEEVVTRVIGAEEIPSAMEEWANDVGAINKLLVKIGQ
jgi:threonine dehydrogenase-like Zn-dependent dehydrogenase